MSRAAGLSLAIRALFGILLGIAASTGCEHEQYCLGDDCSLNPSIDSGTGTVDAAQDPGCENDDQCPGFLSVCKTVTHECVSCLSDADCPLPRTGRCDLNRNQCVQCLSAADCSSGEVCVATPGDCATPCTSASQCDDSGPLFSSFCDPALEVCVQCLEDTDCAVLGSIGGGAIGAGYCELGSCVGCRSNDDCTEASPRCILGICSPCSGSGDCSL
ncbi:MAG: hypothetical protein HRU17_21080 [Polyangiaceae bacterium]|nr:hypothetical protein [Polyangiaceae bacterium]